MTRPPCSKEPERLHVSHHAVKCWRERVLRTEDISDSAVRAQILNAWDPVSSEGNPRKENQMHVFGTHRRSDQQPVHYALVYDTVTRTVVTVERRRKQYESVPPMRGDTWT